MRKPIKEHSYYNGYTITEYENTQIVTVNAPNGERWQADNRADAQREIREREHLFEKQ